jgi:prepilin-type N-terminal cleavage/methylation domain-containing protein
LKKLGPKFRRGFTLLELVLVLVILCTAMALVAPSFTGFRRGAELRDAGDQFIAITRYARTQSAATGTTHRVQIDQSANTYQLLIADADKFSPLGTSWGKTFALPEGLTIQMSKSGTSQTAGTSNRLSQPTAGASGLGSRASQSGSDSYVDFFATGRSDVATVTIRSSHGDAIAITTPSPAEGYIVSPAKSEGP